MCFRFGCRRCANVRRTFPLWSPTSSDGAERQGKVIDEIPDTIFDALRHYSWPGNVRELQNVVERAVIGTSGRTLQMPSTDRRLPAPASSGRTLAEVEYEHIVATLRATNGVTGGWNGAAAKLGLSRTTLISRMQRLGLSTPKRAPNPSAAPARCAMDGTRRRRPEVDAV
ncbi:MAG: helix-turn-helix domain-containing protein [Vicinamibacterales bacterium]